MKISYIVDHLFGLGGTVRTTLTSATQLADRGHEIELVSVRRTRTDPHFAVDPRFHVVTLNDGRKGPHGLPSRLRLKFSRRDRELAAQPAMAVPPEEPRAKLYDGLVEARLRRFLGNTDADVVIGTRCAVNCCLAAYTPPFTVRIAQEHMYLANHKRPARERLLHACAGLDAVVTVTEADAAAYRKALDGTATRVQAIPNATPPSPVAPASGAGTVVVAAGRLAKMKGFDLLIDAFARLAADFPEWKLRIFGDGKERRSLRQQIRELGVQDQVELAGPVVPLDSAWAQAAIAVIPSRKEPFGLTVVEALAAGLPVLAADAKHGPGEIIRSGRDGLLTPPNDPAALAANLKRMMTDPGLRRRLAEQALTRSRDYLPERVAPQHEELFEELLRQKRSVLSVPTS